MLSLPWWILGVNPEENHSENSTVDCPLKELEGIVSIPTTPVLMFHTPSSSPILDVPDRSPKVDDFSTFHNVAKRFSSTTLENLIPPKTSKIEKRTTFERKETDLMKKSDDGQSVWDFDETFRIPFAAEFSRPGSPLAFSDSFNETFNLESFEAEKQTKRSNSPELRNTNTREYPLFFTSFDDTTVLFNTTIDEDYNLNQRNEEVGDWVFKNNKFLKDTKPAESSIKNADASDKKGDGDHKVEVFKEPIKMNTKRTRGRKGSTSGPTESHRVPRRTPVKSVTTVVKTQKHIEKLKGNNEVTELSTPKKPPLERRRTPSRKAKTYKSLKV